MRIRVVDDQPWDVKADVLAVPIIGEPDFGGPLGELDQRTGGELRALATFGELRAKRFYVGARGARRARRGRECSRSRRAMRPASIGRSSIASVPASSDGSGAGTRRAWRSG